MPSVVGHPEMIKMMTLTLLTSQLMDLAKDDQGLTVFPYPLDELLQMTLLDELLNIFFQLYIIVDCMTDILVILTESSRISSFG